jgi:hypothetical protein
VHHAVSGDWHEMEYKIKFLSGLGIWAMTNDEVGVKYLGVLILVSQNTNGRDGRSSNSKPGCQTLKERRKRKKKSPILEQQNCRLSRC